MTDQEIDKIVDIVIERTMLALPKMVASIYESVKSIDVVVKKFYEDNPEFKAHQLLVAKTIQEIESKNFGLPYEKILKMAQPLINKRIRSAKNLNMDKVQDKSQIDTTYHSSHTSNNGAI